MRSVSPLLIASLLGASAACAPDGSSAYVSRNVPLDATCLPTIDGDIGIATGLYDVGTKPASCVHSYLMSLLVNSNLKANAQAATGRAEPNVLLITHADVRIMNKDQATVNFKDAMNLPDATRPNPYRVRTAASVDPTTSEVAQTGLVQIEAIPKAYSSRLSQFVGESIVLEVQLFGTTTGDVDVDFRPFVYPISICENCLSVCTGGPVADDSSGDKCTDIAYGGQDGQVCVGGC